MVDELKGKTTMAELQKALNKLIQEHNALCAKLRGGGMTQAEADAFTAATEKE